MPRTRIPFYHIAAGIGGLFILMGTISDLLGLGTPGGGFGPSQLSLILSGACLIAWSIIFYLHGKARYVYAFVLTIGFSGLWSFWPYDIQWQGIRHWLTAPTSFQLLVGCYLLLGGLALFSSGICVWGFIALTRANRGFFRYAVFWSVLISIAVVMAEGIFRLLLFSEIPALAHLRTPGFYADWFSDDDYWKLHYRFKTEFMPPENPHPLLGWVGNFSRDTYGHDDAQQLYDRRPVLLYGDSYADCATGVTCFQEALNTDPQFSGGHYLLNYGVSGYGVDQIALLFQNSIDLYERPFVVFSLMTFDLDRSILSFRIGQKPYFELENGTLQLRGVPIKADPAQFMTEHPLQISSYVFRKILYSPFVPHSLVAFIRNERAIIEKKKAVNAAILLQTVDELRSRHLPFVILVFHPHIPGISTLDGEMDWRDPFLRDLLEAHQIPYIWSKDIFQQDVDGKGGTYNIKEYISPDHHHPTSYFTGLIANEIKRVVLTETQP